MRILGNRVLVSKFVEPEKEGFKEVEIQDSFVFKGKVEQVSEGMDLINQITNVPLFEINDVVLFSKYSPDTQEVEVEGQTMKIIKVEDILAIL